MCIVLGDFKNTDFTDPAGTPAGYWAACTLSRITISARYRTYDLVAYDKCEVSYTCLTVKERLSSRD